MDFTKIAYRLGFLDRTEAITRGVPAHRRNEVRARLRNVEKVEVLGDVNRAFGEYDALSKIFKELSNENQLTGMARDVSKALYADGSAELFGYRPAGARLWTSFVNPFMLYTFIADRHWAVRALIHRVMTEILHDGFVLKRAKGVSNKRVVEVYRIIKELEIPELRMNLVCP